MLVAYVAAHPSQTALALHDASDPAAAGAALRAAAAKIFQIRHPDEPDEPLPNWCEVIAEDGMPVLHLDMKDEARYAALVVRIILDELAGAGVAGRLAPWQRPPAPVSHDELGMEPSALPAHLVHGHEAVLAVASVAAVLDPLVTAPTDPADRRPRMAVIASRFASVLGRLDAEQLAVIRHVCLRMAANLIAVGWRPRPDGLVLETGMDGRLYAADLREMAQRVVEADLLPALETGATIVQTAPMVIGALTGDRSPFDGLDEEQLTTTRDACQQIVEHRQA